MSDFVQLIKKTSLEAGEAAGPVAVEFGTVASASPIKIRIDQKKLLSDAFLIIPEHLTDHSISMAVSHSTEPAGARSHMHSVTTTTGSGTTDTDSEPNHSHVYTGTKSFMMLNGLKVGEKVILLRMQGGQKYIVLDRVVSG